MFPGTRRVPTKDLLLIRPVHPNEYWLFGPILNDPNRQLKIFQLDTGSVFGISALVDESLVLKSVFKNPEAYKPILHSINGYADALDRVYKVAHKYPILNSLTVVDLKPSTSPTHSKVNYLLAVGKKNKVSLQRNIIYDVPMQLQDDYF